MEMGLSLEEARREFVGKPYTPEIAHEIEKRGFGFTVSCRTGTIADIFRTKPCKFSGFIKLIESGFKKVLEEEKK